MMQKQLQQSNVCHTDIGFNAYWSMPASIRCGLANKTEPLGSREGEKIPRV